MKIFMRYITTGCISFTCSCVLYLFASFFNIFPSIDEQLIITLLFISIGIMLLIYLIHLLPIQSPLVTRILEMFAVLIVLLVASIFFNMVPFEYIYLISVLAIGVVTYAIVLIVLFIGDFMDALQINETIQMRKKREQ